MEFELTSREVLALYLKPAGGKVHRTGEVKEGQRMVDEGIKGELLGVEILPPLDVSAAVRKIARRYKLRGVSQALRNIRTALAPHGADS